MIPVIDDYIQSMIVSKLRILKNNPKLIDFLFQTGNSDTIEKLKEFIISKKIRVVIGYPREPSTLPAYVIMLAPEQEQPSGLGDNWETYGSDKLGDIDSAVEDIAEDYLSQTIASVFMNATYRIECWSDNGDLTAFMYCILKWCLWSCRKEMLRIGWNNIKIEGTDLEPAPDYMPVFVYRRAAQLILTYDNMYHEDVTDSLKILDITANPDKYHKDKDGNILDENNNIIITVSQQLLYNPHFYQDGIASYDIKKTKIQTYFPTLSSFPITGEVNTLYLEQEKTLNGNVTITPYRWDTTTQQYQPTSISTLPGYNDIIVIDRNKGD